MRQIHVNVPDEILRRIDEAGLQPGLLGEIALDAWEDELQWRERASVDAALRAKFGGERPTIRL